MFFAYLTYCARYSSFQRFARLNAKALTPPPPRTRARAFQNLRITTRLLRIGVIPDRVDALAWARGKRHGATCAKARLRALLRLPVYCLPYALRYLRAVRAHCLRAHARARRARAARSTRFFRPVCCAMTSSCRANALFHLLSRHEWMLAIFLLLFLPVLMAFLACRKSMYKAFAALLFCAFTLLLAISVF